MEIKKFSKNFFSKNNYEKYFHREFTQSDWSSRKGQLTPDFRRKNNTKKIQHKINNKNRDNKYNNIRYIFIADK